MIITTTNLAATATAWLFLLWLAATAAALIKTGRAGIRRRLILRDINDLINLLAWLDIFRQDGAFITVVKIDGSQNSKDKKECRNHSKGHSPRIGRLGAHNSSTATLSKPGRKH